MSGKGSRVSNRGVSSKKFSGLPCPLDKTEPPTLRKVIQYSYFLANSNPRMRTYDISKLIAKEIISIWQVANPRLPLLREYYIGQKVDRLCFKAAKQINRKSFPASKVKRIEAHLDKLFDISSCCCKLPILKCDDSAVECNKESCQTKHIVCTCPPHKMVPIEEREYLKTQREKPGPKDCFQLGKKSEKKHAVKKYKKSAAETEKLDRQIERQQQQDSTQIAYLSDSDDTIDESFESGRPFEEPYSLLKVPRYATELIRGDVSPNVGACLANAFLLDLQDMGFLHPDLNLKDIITDKSEIGREMERVK